MKSLHHLRPLIAGLFLAFVAAFPASAQLSSEPNYASETFRKALADLGTTNNYRLLTDTAYAQSTVSEGEFEGLRLSGVYVAVNGNNGWAIVYYVENLSGTPYCIRPKTKLPSYGEKYYVQTVNQIVEPYNKLMIVDIRDPGVRTQDSIHVSFAFWPPNYDAPEGSYCRSVAPEGLQDWVDDGKANWFRNSRRD